MGNHKEFGLQDYPEHRRHLEEEERQLGMEACKTHQQRSDYIRRLVRGIFHSDLSGVQVLNKTRLVFGKKSFTPIPEFERILDTWADFPLDELAEIFEREQARAKKTHLRAA